MVSKHNQIHPLARLHTFEDLTKQCILAVRAQQQCVQSNYQVSRCMILYWLPCFASATSVTPIVWLGEFVSVSVPGWNESCSKDGWPPPKHKFQLQVFENMRWMLVWWALMLASCVADLCHDYVCVTCWCCSFTAPCITTTVNYALQHYIKAPPVAIATSGRPFAV